MLWPKGRQELRFEALTRHLPRGEFTLLDYGCGLAHLRAYLDPRFERCRYSGADMVPAFIDASKAKYPDSEFIVAVTPRDLASDYDHIVLSGVFNMLYSDDVGQHVRDLTSVIAGAARDQSLEHAPLLIFALAATVLVLLMLRT